MNNPYMQNWEKKNERTLGDLYGWLSIEENLNQFNDDLGLDLVLIKELRVEGDTQYSIVAEKNSTADKVLILVFSDSLPEIDLNNIFKRTCNVYIDPKIIMFVTESSHLGFFEEIEWLNMISKDRYCFIHVVDNYKSSTYLEGNHKKFVIDAGKKKFERMNSKDEKAGDDL